MSPFFFFGGGKEFVKHHLQPLGFYEKKHSSTSCDALSRGT